MKPLRQMAFSEQPRLLHTWSGAAAKGSPTTLEVWTGPAPALTLLPSITGLTALPCGETAAGAGSTSGSIQPTLNGNTEQIYVSAIFLIVGATY
jgi:hypothetical protein